MGTSVSDGRNVRGVIFDLWDTLVPFPLHRWNVMTVALSEALAVPLDDLQRTWDEDTPQRMVQAMDECLRRLGSTLDVEVNEAFIAEELARRLRFHQECLARPRPDAAATIQQLRGRGLRIGVVSNATSDVPIAWLGSPLAPLIDACAFSTDDAIAKPDPRIYQRVLVRLGLAPETAVYVGDGAGDELRGATEVGMRAVLLKHSSAPARGWDGEAITSLSELPELLGMH